jgi:hypothetical protein
LRGLRGLAQNWRFPRSRNRELGNPFSWLSPESWYSESTSTLPEVRRLDAEGAQVDVALAAVVNLVVDCILDGGDA